MGQWREGTFRVCSSVIVGTGGLFLLLKSSHPQFYLQLLVNISMQAVCLGPMLQITPNPSANSAEEMGRASVREIQMSPITTTVAPSGRW